jgi:hypothetical protein
MLQAADEAAALEVLHNAGMTDGLPVVIPTAERVANLVLASGLDADMQLGVMGPAGGVATVEKVAVAAVMAGCLAEHIPVVIAAVKAVLEDEFDLSTDAIYYPLHRTVDYRQRPRSPELRTHSQRLRRAGSGVSGQRQHWSRSAFVHD